jgi:capsular exopolysaccharide synthesis family protein
MEPIRYLKGVRRRWYVILATALVGAAVAWFTTATVAPLGPARTTTYRAEAWVINTGGGTTVSSAVQGLMDPNTLQALVTTQSVGNRVAKSIGYQGDPANLLGNVTANSDAQTGILTISATGKSPVASQKVATAFANELIGYLSDFKDRDARQTIAQLQRQLRGLRNPASGGVVLPAGSSSSGQASSGSKSAGSNNPPAGSSTTRSDTQVASLQDQIQQARNQIQTPIPLSVIVPTDPVLLRPTGLQAPTSRAGRVGLGALLGLLAGILIALVLERFDDKLRSKEVAEERFGLPVLAEIPRLPRGDRRTIAASARPTGAPAAAFRLLGAGITRAVDRRHAESNGNGQVVAGPTGAGRGRGGEPSSVILVTSSGPSEGKTTLVANLAAIYGELGKEVLVVSCDLRRPTIHQLFDAHDGPGLTDLLGEDASVPNGGGARPPVADRVLPTPVAHVSILPSGKGHATTAGLLGSDSMRRVIASCRSLADIVLLDTAPILVASEIAPLMAEMDAVVVVADAGKTTGDIAGRTTELLSRLGAPVAGVALNRAAEIAIPKGYSRYYYGYRSPRDDNGSSNGASGPSGPTTADRLPASRPESNA